MKNKAKYFVVLFLLIICGLIINYCQDEETPVFAPLVAPTTTTTTTYNPVCPAPNSFTGTPSVPMIVAYENNEDCLVTDSSYREIIITDAQHICLTGTYQVETTYGNDLFFIKDSTDTIVFTGTVSGPTPTVFTDINVSGNTVRLCVESNDSTTFSYGIDEVNYGP